MDNIGRITLEAEVASDVEVIIEAIGLARQRFDKGPGSGHESCAFQLVRLFNVLEQMGLRIAKAFENHIDDERGWHAELIHRLSIEVPGVRPALYTKEILPALRDLRGFRHVITHAYDLDLDPDRLGLVLKHAESLCKHFPNLTTTFFETVHKQESPLEQQ